MIPAKHRAGCATIQPAIGPAAIWPMVEWQDLMNLLHVGDITQGLELSDAYYKQVFRSSERFTATEVLCRATGDPSCLFIAQRLPCS